MAVTCRVLKLARQPYYRWLKDPVSDRELAEAYLADALFDAHRDDPEFGYRFLAGEARQAGSPPVTARCGGSVRTTGGGRGSGRNSAGPSGPRPARHRRIPTW